MKFKEDVERDVDHATNPAPLVHEAKSCGCRLMDLRRRLCSDGTGNVSSLDGRLLSQQPRGPRRIEREGSKLLEYAGVNGKILLTF